MMNVFITGTDTDVGKTIITAGLAAVLQSLGFNVGVYKPVQSGGMYDNSGKLCSPDLEFVKKIDNNVLTHCTYMLETPAAPIVSAALESEVIDMNAIIRDYKSLSAKCDIVIVEGAGGISVPIAPSLTYKDLAKALHLPTLCISRPSLGTINHSILTAEYADKYGLEFLGFIISGYPVGTKDVAIKTAPRYISNFTNKEVLGIVPYIPGISLEKPQPEALIEAVIQNVNLERIFRVQLQRL